MMLNSYCLQLDPFRQFGPFFFTQTNGQQL